MSLIPRLRNLAPLVLPGLLLAGLVAFLASWGIVSIVNESKQKAGSCVIFASIWQVENAQDVEITLRCPDGHEYKTTGWMVRK